MVQWLGTAGYRIEALGSVLLFDPYLTRSSLWDCATQPLFPDEALLRRLIPRADAIVLGHTHFDHALDTPEIARRTGATVFGSTSAERLCLRQGVAPRQIVNVESQLPKRDSYEVGPFSLRFFPSAHSPLALGRVPMAGEIHDCSDVSLKTRDYRCGAVFGVEVKVLGRVLFHLGSAEILDQHFRTSANADLLMLTVAGWRATRHFPERVVRALDPKAIVLGHWDNFFRPLGGSPLVAGTEGGAACLPTMQIGRLRDRLLHASREVEVGALPHLGYVEL